MNALRYFLLFPLFHSFLRPDFSVIPTRGQASNTGPTVVQYGTGKQEFPRHLELRTLRYKPSHWTYSTLTALKFDYFGSRC
jgi:hypothetical protein